MKSEIERISSEPELMHVDVVSEGGVEFDEKKMRKLIDGSKLLSFFYDEAFANKTLGDQTIGLEAMFHTFVLGTRENGTKYMKMYKSINENGEAISEEWRGYKPNMPVQVVGVKNGKITSNGGGVEVFKNLKDAQKKYSDLDPEENTKRFTWVMAGEVNGKDAGRFETWQAERMYSMEEAEKSLKPRINEKFNSRILPANLEDLEMKTLIVAIGSTVVGLLDRIKKNTGSNANPVSLQVIKGGDAIKSALKKNLDLRGKEALVAFFKETNKHFDASAPVISSIVRKYKLKSDKYSGKVFAEQETKLRELVRQYLTRVTEAAGINIPDNIVDLQDRIAQKKADVSWWEKKLQKSRKRSLIAIRAMHHQQAKKDLKDLENALKKAQKNESIEEPIEEAKKSKMIPMEKYGAAFMVDNGVLLSVAMLRDGSFETWDGDLDWGEVTAPQDQKFLDDINKKFKTKFKMDDFSGR
jgi:hypothetical protein